MKKAVVIVLSLILIGIQTMVAVQTTVASSVSQQTSACCKAHCCCVTETASVPQSLPVATTPAVGQTHFLAVLSDVVEWTLPDSTSLQLSALSSPPSLATALPLFQRDCALLI